MTTWWLTARIREYAVARQIVDVPNDRSSHAVATPRGGGAAIVLAMLGALALVAWSGAVPWPPVMGLMAGGAIAAAVGFIDDHGHVPAKWRLLGHLAAAICVLASLGGVPPLTGFGLAIGPGWIGNGIAVLYVVWVLNLTNFMDGIDGLAGVETVTVCLSGALLYLVVDPVGEEWQVPILLASATTGFLAWNWPPARIFMGDVGSGFVGLALAAMSLRAAWVNPTLFWGWIILLGVFVVDATVTLVRRVARGETFSEAHRSHAYQHAARRLAGHRTVTLVVGAINVVWLLPIALLVTYQALDGPSGVVVAYTPLLGAALVLRAGTPAT